MDRRTRDSVWSINVRQLDAVALLEDEALDCRVSMAEIERLNDGIA